ncbi:protein translocase SEC61 complex subunit gamma [Candidatus Bathyarchaeota archaeon]|nr:MAG: protein translocase SEC61 complex subunit gamma [Candidatus Bathyarchaeota archaeon]TEU06216.1 MAG: protein translocase SEC61 complex subunit gamma [Candidatus Bathyarchaeota archaeon]
MRVTMGLRSFFQSCARMLKLATKPGRSELWLSIKVCFLGTVAIGAIGFLIHLIATMLGE